jgi:predicted ATP-binding protein involved in virulence
MEIKRLKLENFRGITRQEIELLPNMNVFVGINGAGKSTILDAIAISLSWLVEGIQNIENIGINIPLDSIKNKTNYSSIILDILENNKIYSWEKMGVKKGYSIREYSKLSEVSNLSYIYQEKYQDLNQLPIIIYYPINRITEGISRLKINGNENISQFDVYDNSLGSKANFQSFFEWFRLQDDIINEQAQSRTKYIKNHRDIISNNIEKIFNLLESIVEDENISNIKENILTNESILLEPKYFFFELMNLIMNIDFKNDILLKSIENLLYLIFKLLLIEKDSIINDSNLILSQINEIFKELSNLKKDNSSSDDNLKLQEFIWSCFRFSLRLTFWWFSNKGKEELERILKHLRPKKTKFKDNEITFMFEISQVIKKNIKRLEQALLDNGKELKIVTKTIEQFTVEYSNLRVTRTPTPHMLLEKNGETLNLNQLSDGEKNMIAMVGDIARRLSMANPNLDNPLDGEGIVMIDEIDLHLHPSWQRLIITRLVEIFPNCQFIVTTHSPQILSHIKAEHIFLLEQKENNISLTKPTESYGKSSDRQLEDILGVEARPLEIKKELARLFQLIQDSKIGESKELMFELENTIEGREVELVKANILIKRKEILGI